MAVKTPTKQSRLNIRIPRSLLLWVKAHAKSHNTTVTQMIVDQLTALRKAETDVDQV